MSTDTNDREAVGVPRILDAQSNVADVSPSQVTPLDTDAPNAAVVTPNVVEKRIRTNFSVCVDWLGRSIPTALVFTALAGIGYWGHHHGWKIPKFSELASSGASGGIAWCTEHGVLEAECIACNADLMPKGELYGWCREHGVHECVLHHPEIAQLDEIPEISPNELERAAQAIALRLRTKNDPACKMHLRRIQFPSKAAVDKVGIDINLVDRGPVVESVSAVGEIIYNPTLVARLASRAAGTVWRVERNVGDQVQEGEILALVDAAEVGRAKAQLLQSLARLDLHTKTYERLYGLGTVVAGRRVLESQTARAEAEVAVQQAIQTLVNLGLPISDNDVSQSTAAEIQESIRFLGLPLEMTRTFDASRTTSNLLPVVAPRDGIVVARDVVAGEVINTARTLFTVVDTSRMWLVLNVPLEEARHVAIGQKVIFHPDGVDHTDTGTLTWISTDVDTVTRTVRVRGELSNEDAHLRNETFGAGEIILREEQDAIIVPSTAVHWEGCCHVAFVRDKDWFTGPYNVFHTRSVRPGVIMGDTTEMIAGLLPGEVVVTQGSGVLRAELLKGNLGAG